MSAALAGDPRGVSSPPSVGDSSFPRDPSPCFTDAKEQLAMNDTTVRRVRHPRTNESERKNAAAALQRALDRRDNGGSTGH